MIRVILFDLMDTLEKDMTLKAGIVDGVAGRMVQNPTLAKRQGKEDDFVEDLNTPFLGAHRSPCSPRRDPSACPGYSSWEAVAKRRHYPSVFDRPRGVWPPGISMEPA